MAITFREVVIALSDNGSQASDNLQLFPSAAQNGDLMFVYAAKRTATGAISISSAGGQTWNSFTTTASGSATLSGNAFWCVYNGTITGNLTFTFNATTNNNVVMLVFAPTSSSYTWAVDSAQTGSFTSKAAAATFTITGWTPANASSVSIGVANTDDDNTWTISGTGWTQGTLSAQYRNLAGSDTSMSFAYQIKTSATATNNLVFTEATLGNDGGLTFSICFYEISAVVPVTGGSFFRLRGRN